MLFVETEERDWADTPHARVVLEANRVGSDGIRQLEVLAEAWDERVPASPTSNPGEDLTPKYLRAAYEPTQDALGGHWGVLERARATREREGDPWP